MTEDRGNLAVRWLPMARGQARRRARARPATFDLYYDACVDALLKAAEDFVPARGVEFSTVAYHYMRSAMNSAFRASRRQLRDPGREELSAGRARPTLDAENPSVPSRGRRRRRGLQKA